MAASPKKNSCFVLFFVSGFLLAFLYLAHSWLVLCSSLTYHFAVCFPVSPFSYGFCAFAVVYCSLNWGLCPPLYILDLDGLHLPLCILALLCLFSIVIICYFPCSIDSHSFHIHFSGVVCWCIGGARRVLLSLGSAALG